MVARRLALLAMVVVCLALSSPVWAGSSTFDGTAPKGQGALNFTPGVGDSLTVGAGNGGLGALVTDLFLDIPGCGAGCDYTVTGGYTTLTSGKETSGFSGGGAFSYNFAGGGTLKIIGGITGLGIANGSTLLTLSFLPGATFSGGGSTGVYQGLVDLSSIMLNPVLHLAIGGVMFNGGANDEVTLQLFDNNCGTGGKCFGPLLTADTGLQFIPEPATLSVLGAGLFAFGAGLRRKMAAG